MRRTHREEPVNHQMVALLEACKKTLGIRGKVRIAYSHSIHSPILIGLLKPTILIPSSYKCDSDLQMVLHHELLHLKRKDLWVKQLVLIVRILHWFNPLVYLLGKEIHVWSELSCDQEVAKGMSHAERKRYGWTILNALESATDLPSTTFCASFSGTREQLKRRLTLMLNGTKMKKKAVARANNTK